MEPDSDRRGSRGRRRWEAGPPGSGTAASGRRRGRRPARRTSMRQGAKARRRVQPRKHPGSEEKSTGKRVSKGEERRRTEGTEARGRGEGRGRSGRRGGDKKKTEAPRGTRRVERRRPGRAHRACKKILEREGEGGPRAAWRLGKRGTDPICTGKGASSEERGGRTPSKACRRADSLPRLVKPRHPATAAERARRELRRRVSVGGEGEGERGVVVPVAPSRLREPGGALLGRRK